MNLKRMGEGVVAEVARVVAAAEAVIVEVVLAVVVAHEIVVDEGVPTHHVLPFHDRSLQVFIRINH